MIRLKEEHDRNRFCFFLKRGDDLECYRYKTIIFGFVSSPFILNYVLQHHAAQYPADTCSWMLKNNFYVDNLVRTANDEEELAELYSSAVKRMKEGGFDLRSCNSNSHKIRLKMEADQTLSTSDSSWEKVLGYRYSPTQDFIKIAEREIDQEAGTKRTILSEASKIFDPLSLCLPVTIRSRLLMRELWKKKLEWDQPVPEALRNEWKNIAGDLSLLKNLEFPRRSVAEGDSAELYIFCDASKQAYGFTAYAVISYCSN